MASIVSSLLTICSPGPLTLGQMSHHVASSPVERSRWEALKSLTKTQQGTGLPTSTLVNLELRLSSPLDLEMSIDLIPLLQPGESQSQSAKSLPNP